jgi:hypothetical protein
MGRFVDDAGGSRYSGSFSEFHVRVRQHRRISSEEKNMSALCDER